MIKSILVGLGDLAYSQSATDHAIDLAKRHEVRLSAVTLVDPDTMATGPVPIGAGEAAKELREHRLELTEDVLNQAVEYFTQACEAAGICFDVQREEGYAFEKIIKCSRYHDLLICGLRNLFTHGVVQEPPSELVRLVEEGVRPLVAVSEHYREVKRALIAYSGSIESSKAMKRFVQLQLWPDAEVRIVTFDTNVAAGQKRLDAAAAYCQTHSLRPETDLVKKPAKESLLPYAAGWNADLIVMGNSRKRFLLRRIFGETVLDVIANSNRSLFLSQ
jgi:nucleotide-binding universal stress UspA family protein